MWGWIDVVTDEGNMLKDLRNKTEIRLSQDYSLITIRPVTWP